MSPFKAITLFAIGGVGGWLLENITAKSPRYSNVFDKRPVPFLPIYGVGLLSIATLSPRVAKLSTPLRGAIYGAALAGIELLGCKLDRRLGPASWDYGKGNCTDLPHMLLWSASGLLIETAI